MQIGAPIGAVDFRQCGSVFGLCAQNRQERGYGEPIERQPDRIARSARPRRVERGFEGQRLTQGWQVPLFWLGGILQVPDWQSSLSVHPTPAGHASTPPVIPVTLKLWL